MITRLEYLAEAVVAAGLIASPFWLPYAFAAGRALLGGW